ncbi:hypothetical protein B0H66DRAFT_596753 [Apodospora peruviana]|uniref:Uncharacterized protein n=1 Tax=Apodospora peruviana TaxID=516989 RepID=A0AAE0IQA9_9PEZI|nr:hypothetical protein B0H66DRAFT_596753 [Apodospora peruviana]
MLPISIPDKAIFIFNLLLLLAGTKMTTALPPSNMNPHDDEFYSALVRKNQATFHVNLSAGNYILNGALVSPDTHWNYDGTMHLGRDNFVTALGAVVGGPSSPLHGLQIFDQYSLVDGGVGMVLYRLTGKLAAPLPAVPLSKPGRPYSALGVERLVFDEDGLLYDLVTVDQFGRIAAQTSGSSQRDAVGQVVPEAGHNGTQQPNPQTPASFRDLVRRNLATLHRNVNAGNPSANAMRAVEDVVVNDNGVLLRRGRQAFVNLVSCQSAGLNAFPEKRFHDFYVLADGHQGGVEYVWHGEQKATYRGIEVKEGVKVRVRGMMFFEMNGDGLVTKVTNVHNEAHVLAQVSGKGGYLYP